MTRRQDQTGGGFRATGFGHRLRVMRNDRGLTTRVLGELAGVHPTTITRLESGRHEPAWPVVVALAAGLDVTPDHFLPRPGDPPPPDPRARPRHAKRGRPPKGPAVPEGRPLVEVLS